MSTPQPSDDPNLPPPKKSKMKDVSIKTSKTPPQVPMVTVATSSSSEMTTPAFVISTTSANFPAGTSLAIPNDHISTEMGHTETTEEEGREVERELSDSDQVSTELKMDHTETEKDSIYLGRTKKEEGRKFDRESSDSETITTESAKYAKENDVSLGGAKKEEGASGERELGTVRITCPENENENAALAVSDIVPTEIVKYTFSSCFQSPDSYKQGEHYNRIVYLGNRMHSNVYRVEDTNQGCYLACKKIEISKDTDSSQEVDTYLKIHNNHPNVVKVDMITVDKRDKFLNIYMELIIPGSLRNAVRSGIRFSIGEISEYGCQILHGVTFLHENNIIHGDIHDENILFDEGNKLMKLADFDLSHIRSNEDDEFWDKLESIDVVSAKECILFMAEGIMEANRKCEEQLQKWKNDGPINAKHAAYGLQLTCI